MGLASFRGLSSPQRLWLVSKRLLASVHQSWDMNLILQVTEVRDGNENKRELQQVP